MLCAWPLLPTAFAAGLVTRRIFVDKSKLNRSNCMRAIVVVN